MNPRHMVLGILLGGITLATAATVEAQYPKDPPQAMELRPIQFPPFQEARLRNGLTLLVVENHRLPVVSINLTMLAGARSDPSGAEGLAAMTGALLTKGTERRSAEQIAEEIESVGSSLFASAGNDFFSVRTTVLTDHLELAFDLLSDVLLNSTFPEEELELERTRTLSALQVQKSNPSSLASKYFSRAIYGDHPYGRSISEESIGGITRESVREYADTYLKPGGGLLVVSGDITLDQARSLARRSLGSWSGSPPEVTYPDPPEAQGTEIILVHRPGSVQANIRVGNLALRPDDESYYAGVVMNRVLGGGSDARLFDILREQKSWTYGAYSGLARRKDIGYFQANTEVRTPVTDSALVELIYQLNRIRDEAVPGEELAGAKGYLVGSFPLSIQTPQQIAGQIANVRLMGLGDDYLRTYHQRLDAIDAERVMDAARRIISVDSAVVVVVGDGTALYDKLTAISAVRIIDPEGNPLTPEDLAPSTEAIAFDLEQVVTRSDSFQILVQGNPFGTLTQSVNRGETVTITSVFNLGGAITTTLTLDPETLTPRQLDQTGMQQGRSIEIHVSYGSDGAVTGTASVPTPPTGEQQEIAIDTVVGANVIDDNMLQGLLGAIDLADGASFSVPAFDATQNRVTQYSLSVSDGGSVTVPAGTYDTWKVDVTGGQFPTAYYVTKASPRHIAKIEFIGPPVIFELVSSTP